MLEPDSRYLQIAFNDDLAMVRRILPTIAPSERILIEAGTPFLKREGMAGLRVMRSLWRGGIVADLKTTDGAEGEVEMARAAGATAITALGSSPNETLALFVQRCAALGMDSMIDMLGVADPLRVLLRLRTPPHVVVLHRGRDEESSRKVIEYRHVKRLKSKYDVILSAAGGVDLHEARSAIFNGASIVVANIVPPGSPWQGIPSNGDVRSIAEAFLQSIEA
jgi:bifunctional enzyme Fae/Hps